ncbi:MAG: DUF4956 domain-containing protein [Planctomycetes bacterium]|nr:DUF4956 domain-containing protein [Planctomycetota bacterium]
MEQLHDPYLSYAPGLSWRMILLTMLMSFVLCQVLAAVYSFTFRGLSYSRGFVIALVLTGVIATMLMLAIGNGVARGIGLLGALAVIRFRSTLRDVRDVMFIFASLAVGIAVGVQAFLIAGLGALTFSIFMLHLTFSPFASRRQFDGLLRLNTGASPDADLQLKRALRDSSFQQPLVDAIRAVDEIADVSLLMQDPALEV